MRPSAAATARPWCGIRPVAGIDRDGRDLLGRVVRDLLDFHPAFGRGDDGDPARLAVNQQREIEFLRDVDTVGDVEALDLLAVRAGLDRHQRLTEHLGRILANLVDRTGKADAALRRLGKFLELALAAAAGVDLCLDDPERPGKPFRDLDRFLGTHCGIAGRNRHAELREQFLGLIFVDVHGRRALIRTRLRCKATNDPPGRSSTSTWTPFTRPWNSATTRALRAYRSRSVVATAEL